MAATLGACGTGDTRVDPADLELRDLLGMSPEVASHWDADQRASARKVLLAGLHDGPGEGATIRLELTGTGSIDAKVAQTLVTLDARRAQDGGNALGMVQIARDPRSLVVSAAAAPMATTAIGGGTVANQEIWLAEQWDQQHLSVLAGRGLDLMAGLALDAGHTKGPVVVVPVAHLAVIAGYVRSHDLTEPARLVLNPVMLAALEPNDGLSTGGADPVAVFGGTTTTAAAIKAGAPVAASPQGTTTSNAVGGNPYSFYGSYEECASAQRNRCEACLPNRSCRAITSASDGNAECTQLGGNNGKGYYELCINLALAISAVNNCTANKVPSCLRSATAADSLTTLDANVEFLTDSSCSDGLDACLAEIYGAPSGNFPSPTSVDGGIVPPSNDPPRDVSPSCGHACSNNTSASPNCDCKGGNCGNSLTCSSGCAASNSQSGCEGDAGSCSSDDANNGGGSCADSSSPSDSGCSGGSNPNDTGSCSSDNSGDSCSGGSSSSSGSSCDNSGSSSDSCGSGSSTDSCGSSSSSSSSGSCGSSSGGDSCGSSSSGSSSCGSSGSSSGCSSSSSSGSGCSVTKKEPSAMLAVVVSAAWGIMPVPIAALVKRRARKKKKKADAAKEAAL